MKINLTILREVVNARGEEDTLTIQTQVIYTPGEDGIWWGSPDNWEDDISHDIEVISATCNGEAIDLTEKEERELLDLAYDVWQDEEGGA